MSNDFSTSRLRRFLLFVLIFLLSFFIYSSWVLVFTLGKNWFSQNHYEAYSWADSSDTISWTTVLLLIPLDYYAIEISLLIAILFAYALNATNLYRKHNQSR